MNKIMLIAKGNFDSKKLISALQSMILDPSSETVKVVQGYGMKYVSDEGTFYKPKTIGKENFFMGQIIDKNVEDDFPGVITIEKNKRSKKDYWLFGALNDEQVRKSTIVDDLIRKHPDKMNKEDKIKIYKNPELLLRYLFLYEDDSIINVLNEYGIRGMYSILGLDKDYPAFKVETTREWIFFDGYSREYNADFYCNSKEVLDSLGIESHISSRYDKFRGYYPYGRSYSGGECVDFLERKKVLENSRFVTGREKAISDFEQSKLLTISSCARDGLIEVYNPIYEFQKLASKCLVVHNYKFKSKSKSKK